MKAEQRIINALQLDGCSVNNSPVSKKLLDYASTLLTENESLSEKLTQAQAKLSPVVQPAVVEPVKP